MTPRNGRDAAAILSWLTIVLLAASLVPAAAAHHQGTRMQRKGKLPREDGGIFAPTTNTSEAGDVRGVLLGVGGMLAMFWGLLV